MKSFSTYKNIFLVTLLFCFHSIVIAQYQTYVNPLTRTLDKQSAEVGTLPGYVNVNSLGAATYVIPVFISPGTAGMQPSLSVTYNSKNGDGILGPGWDISGLSEIRRVPKNFYHDNQVDGVDLQNTDVFALDSNRLILTTGTYGADNSVYATEYETFVKVTAYGSAGTGPSWFKVETKGGRTLEYGNTTDSKVEGYGSSTVYMWRINKVYDKDGNTIKFIYNEVSGESYISRIDYTTNDGAGLTTPYNSIKFEYATRTDIESRYVGGRKIPATKLLTWIKVETENSSTVRKYNFEYFLDSLNKSYLNEITEYGGDNSHYNSTVIGWGTPGDHFSENESNTNTTINFYYRGDFNGDGRTDYVVTPKKTTYSGSDKWELYLATEDGIMFDYVNQGYLNSNFKAFYVADVDGNGNDELLWKSVETITYNCNPYPCNPHPCQEGPPDSLEPGEESESQSEVIDIVQPADTCWDTCWETCSYIRVSFLNYSYTEGTGIVRGDNSYDYIIDYADPGLYLMPGDFDYNGQTDYMVLYSNKTLYLTRINGVSRFGMSFTSPNDLKIIDFDGDGRKEVLVVKNSNSYIYQYNSISQAFSSIYSSTTFPTSSHRIFTGDFNGDRKTDLLTWKSGNYWQLNYSTGTGFFTSTTTPALYYKDPNESTLNYNYYVADYNGDTKDDIIEAYYSGSYRYLKVFYSRGDGVFNIESNQYSKSAINQDYFNIGDFNGDGKKDVFYYNFASATNKVNIAFFHKDELRNFVSSIANGLNIITKITYDRINTYPALRGNDAVYPVIDYLGPYYVVHWVQRDDGDEDFNLEHYHWEKAKKHRLGKGFLGFKEYYHQSDAINTLDRFEYELNDQYNYLSLKDFFSLNTASGNDTIKHTIIGNDLKVFNDKRIFPYVKTSINSDTLLRTSVLTINDYDTCGNLIYTKSSYINFNGDSSVCEAIKSATYVYQQYGNYGIPNKVTFATDSSTYLNEALYSRSKSFTYDESGKLATEIVDPNKDKSVTANYSYNDFGNLTKVIVSATNLPPRPTTYTFDPKGRFITSITDTLNNCITKSYYPGTGNIKREVSPDNQIMTWRYDSLGRQTETVTPQGNHIYSEIEWSAALPNSSFKITKETPENYFTTYYDHLGREIRSQTSNITGTVLKDTYYNSSGQVDRETLPYFNGEDYGNIKWKRYSYDYFGRLEKDSLSSQSYTHFFYNGTTTTITRGEDYEKAVRTNSLGQTVYSNDLGSVVTTTYFSNGQPKNMNADGTIVAFYYDEYGRQDSIKNPNSGTTKYAYNAFGELNSQEDANGLTTSLQNDILGRTTLKTGPEGNTTYSYIQNGNGKGQLQSITGPDGISQSYDYDSFGRVVQITDSIPGDQTLATSFTYDSWNNITSMTYPSGFSIINEYTDGALSRIRKSDNSIIWQADSVNSFMQPLKFTLGSASLVERYTYDLYGNLCTKSLNNNIQFFEFDPMKGNLLSRITSRPGLGSNSESFEYDTKNRLTVSQVEEKPEVHISYDDSGNILHKSGIGLYRYKLQSNRMDSLTASSQNNSKEDQSYTYTSENLTASISQDSLNLQLLYGPTGNRIKTILLNNGDTTKIKYYSGNFEMTVEGTEIHQFNYIYCPYGLIAVNIDFGESDTTYYVETDHLGSIIGLLRPDGSYVEKYSYDAWGRQRNPVTWTYDSIPRPTIIDRGYTGHEHLDEFDLINMNGRIYDPYVGRFLSVDPVIQFTGNSQSFNGYSYCLNNPLIYIDPSGYSHEGILEWLKRLFSGKECKKGPHEEETARVRHNMPSGNEYTPNAPPNFDYFYTYQNGITVGGGSLGPITTGGGGGNTGTSISQDPGLGGPPNGSESPNLYNPKYLTGCMACHSSQGIYYPYLAEYRAHFWINVAFVAATGFIFEGISFFGLASKEGGFGVMMGAKESARYAKYWESYAPKQVTPGTSRFDWLRISGRTGSMESSRVIYDDFGRQIYRIDFSNHMRVMDHSVPHLHQTIYGPSFSNTGFETLYNFWWK